jgi:hypothetical protein
MYNDVLTIYRDRSPIKRAEVSGWFVRSERRRMLGRLIPMRVRAAFALAAGLLVSAGCGDALPRAEPESGVTGLVHLGPQCPVETAGDPCEDQPAANVTVTISEQIPGDSYAAGDVVARATTGAHGTYRVAVPPGDYVVTADAGMSCEMMDARVTVGEYTTVEVPCDTGIR